MVKRMAMNASLPQQNSLAQDIPLTLPGKSFVAGMTCQVCRQGEAGTAAACISYMHANAEAIPVEDGSQDMVSSSYLVHELPAAATKGFLRDAHRALRPGGVIAIVDGDPW